jgi:hypothetical protein
MLNETNDYWDNADYPNDRKGCVLVKECFKNVGLHCTCNWDVTDCSEEHPAICFKRASRKFYETLKTDIVLGSCFQFVYYMYIMLEISSHRSELWMS